MESFVSTGTRRVYVAFSLLGVGSRVVVTSVVVHKTKDTNSQFLCLVPVFSSLFVTMKFALLLLLAQEEDKENRKFYGRYTRMLTLEERRRRDRRIPRSALRPHCEFNRLFVTCSIQEMIKVLSMQLALTLRYSMNFLLSFILSHTSIVLTKKTASKW